jgi:glycosyltransferase involved in cell wall biosynthesis
VNITELAQFVDDGTRRRCFDAADAVLLPYMRGFEGQSEVLFDAASAAIPVIASDSGEVGRMVRHHQLGLTFEPENATSLRQTMGRFSQLSCADRAAIREQLRAFAAARSWLHVAEEHIRVYAACQVAA